jgi:hypothetical protein
MIDGGGGTLDPHQRTTGRYVPAEAGHGVHHTSGASGDVHQLVASDADQHAGRGREDHVRGRGSHRLEWVGVLPVEQPAGLVADELDQGRHPQRAPDVVHVQHQHGDAGQHQDVGDHDRHAGHLTVTVELHFAHRQHGVGKRGHEQADRQLARAIPQERLDDRGENCPIASCTTTIVIVSTSVANYTIDTAIVSRIAVAASGPPVNDRGTASNSNQRSTPIVPIETATPASTHITGMNHRLERTLEQDALLMDRSVPTRTSAEAARRRTRARSPARGNSAVGV